jgi:hypothetical protein
MLPFACRYSHLWPAAMPIVTNQFFSFSRVTVVADRANCLGGNTGKITDIASGATQEVD